MADYKYKAFISYSHQDEQWARWLHRGLEGYRVPKRIVAEQNLETSRLTPIFRDRDELASASDLSSTIVDALRESESLIVICSPSAAQSRWVNQEVEQFGRLRDPSRVFCLLIDDPAQSFPPALTEQGEVEPLAADVRDHADGKRGARLKLVAGLMSLPYDALRQREARRRTQRLVGVAASSVAGMVLTSALAVFALLAREEADEQRRLARAEAETAQNVSDFLVDLFKVTDPNENNGETVTARQLLDRGQDRIAVLSDEPTVQMRLISTMVEVYLNLGLFDQARQLSNQGLEIARQAQDAQAIFRAESDLALVEHFAGDPDAARRWSRSALDRAMLSDDPTMMAGANQTHGRVLMVGSEYEAARPYLSAAVRLYSEAYGSDDPRLSEPLNLLGALDWYVGDLDAAREAYERVLAIQERAYGPEHYRLAGTLNNLAIVYDQALDWPAAVAIHERVLKIRQRVLAPDHPDIAESLNNLGNALTGMGEHERALAAFGQALLIRRDKYGYNAKTALALANLGHARLLTGDLDGARENLEEGVAMYEGTVGAAHSGIAYALLGLGLLEQRLGRFALARRHIERAVSVREAGQGDSHYLLIKPLHALFEIAVSEGDMDRALKLYKRTVTVSAMHTEELRTTLAAPPDLSRIAEQLAGVSVDVVLDQIKEFYALHSALAHKYMIVNIYQYWVDTRRSDAVSVHVEYSFRQLRYGMMGCDARVFDLRREKDTWVVEAMGPGMSARFHAWQCDARVLADSTGHLRGESNDKPEQHQEQHR